MLCACVRACVRVQVPLFVFPTICINGSTGESIVDNEEEVGSSGPIFVCEGAPTMWECVSFSLPLAAPCSVLAITVGISSASET